ncbi:hypothetical protein MANES_05G010600v8 [Manihot esculenta]|nr:hypothetical protein MANES_05G010600v8 [Manihot esculenta]
MLLYDLEAVKIIESFQVFQGIRVHGITCGFVDYPEGSSSSRLAFKVVVFGEKRVKLFNLYIEIALKSQNQPQVCVDLVLLHSLPRFSHWVLDVLFLQNHADTSHEEGSHCLAIGCSDNSVHIWDISRSSVILRVQSPERCLLYSMRLWGDNLEALRIASGTIYNEIIIWKVVLQHGALPLTSTLEDDMPLKNSRFKDFHLHCQQHKAVHISRLIGHEGSIFRIVWSSDGSKLVSVSDDRSARIWAVKAEQKNSDNQEVETAGPILFGHNARVWDCCISDSLIVTAGEDCTCRIWGLDGKQLNLIKEHIGRGIWRCLYDPNSSLLITAGFDSAIKVHQLPASFPQSLEGQIEPKFIDRTDIFTSQLPNSSENVGLMDSKSEYIRCLHFTCGDVLYVATNNGYLYHAKLQTQSVKWTKLVEVSEKVPIVCMDLLTENLPRQSCSLVDWVALGDGKGNMTVVRVMDNAETPDADFTLTWSAGKERQLLGTYWSKALGHRFIFTADPRGVLKLWKLNDSLSFVSHSCARTIDVSLVAEFTSCFGIRIMCLDVSSEDEVLVCGDLRGNLILFPLSKGLLLYTPAAPETKIFPLTYFKGAHGISTVSSICISKLSSNEIEICSTGGDGCLCYFEYDQDQQSWEFIGMKQVKGLSLIQSLSNNNSYPYDLANCGYAIGFASTDFIIWNLTTEAKVLQIPCGGWRRPHSYYLSDIPEMESYFAYVKDEVIYIHRQRIPKSEMKIFPQSLHIQFHGREMHSLCFVYENVPTEAIGKCGLFDKCSWVATGCEDGTVRLTRYAPGVESWSTSKLLGEHVGGSAVRSICFVSKMHMMPSDMTNLSDWRNNQSAFAEDRANPFLLISVGAKRVLTSWLLRNRMQEKKRNPLIGREKDKNENGDIPCINDSSSMSFKWLSTDMPTKNSSTHWKTKSIDKIRGMTENVVIMKKDVKSLSHLQDKGETESESLLDDKVEDDWRYLAVTSFLVKCTGSRLTVCFIAVACSDATLALRALVLPHRLWFDVALLVPLLSPVLSLQHVIIPTHLHGEPTWMGEVYILISGATDGSIAFWDLTDSIAYFMRQLSALDVKKLINCQTRPRTGRGSQGGRWWRSLKSSMSKQKVADDLLAPKTEDRTSCNLDNRSTARASTSDAESCTTFCSQTMHNKPPLDAETDNVNITPEISEIQPLDVLHNIHQSGVNCLHVSNIQDPRNNDTGVLFSLISGGDDQALHCLKFDLSLFSRGKDSEIAIKDSVHSSEVPIKKYRIRFLYHDRITSAHSSAIKGVWTDGTWVFSTGLDQRIRCWVLKDDRKLIEQTHLIISVPEPEALCARACASNRYEIVVAGRGMQMVEFLAS